MLATLVHEPALLSQISIQEEGSGRLCLDSSHQIHSSFPEFWQVSATNNASKKMAFKNSVSAVTPYVGSQGAGDD